jgi:hypothetical protein
MFATISINQFTLSVLLPIKVSNQQGFKTHNRYTAAPKVINRAQPD